MEIDDKGGKIVQRYESMIEWGERLYNGRDEI